MNPISFYKCLAEETRLKCLLLLTEEHELCVCELTQALNETQPKISRHLAQLRKCNLLEIRRDGYWVYYKLSESLPKWAHLVLRETLKENRTFLSQNIINLEKMVNRPSQCN